MNKNYIKCINGKFHNTSILKCTTCDEIKEYKKRLIEEIDKIDFWYEHTKEDVKKLIEVK